MGPPGQAGFFNGLLKITMDHALIFSGALTGLTVGLTGVGGGALMTPLLLLIFDVTPFVAVGTDLWFAAITKIFATRVHHNHGLIDWMIVTRMWLGSLPASAITLTAIDLYSVGQITVTMLTTVIAAAVVITALGMLFQKYLHALGRRLRTSNGTRFKALQAFLTIVGGAAIGILVTLTSVGAGALGTVFLTYLYPLRLTPPRLIATDIAHAIPLALFSGVGHLLMGNVNFAILGTLLLGSIPAVLIGSMLSSRLSHNILRILLATVLLVVSIKLWLTATQSL